jgi:hypothetical protein
VTALAFGGDAVVVGDRSGSVIVAPVGGEREPRSVQLGAAVGTIAFAPGAERLAIGSDAGRVAVLDVADLAQIAAVTLPAPVRWASYSPDGGHLLVATDAWLHAFVVASGYAPVASRLMRLPARHPNLAATGGVSVHVAGLDGTGALERAELDLAAAPAVTSARSSRSRSASTIGRPAVFFGRICELTDGTATAPHDKVSTLLRKLNGSSSKRVDSSRNSGTADVRGTGDCLGCGRRRLGGLCAARAGTADVLRFHG